MFIALILVAVIAAAWIAEHSIVAWIWLLAILAVSQIEVVEIRIVSFEVIW